MALFKITLQSLLLILAVYVILYAIFQPHKVKLGSDAQYSYQSKREVRRGLIEMTGSP
jgi:hypothetical protein